MRLSTLRLILSTGVWMFGGEVMLNAATWGPPVPPVSPAIPSRVLSADSQGARPGNTADDAPLLQKAIDALSAQGGGTLQFSAGTYLCYVNPSARTGVLRIPSNIRLQGSPSGTTILLAPAQGAYGAIFYSATPVSNVDIESLTFDNNGLSNPVSSQKDYAAGARAAIRLQGSRMIRINQCTFRNQVNQNAVALVNTTTTLAGNIEISNSTFTAIGGTKIDYDHSSIYIQDGPSWVHQNSFQSRYGTGTRGSRTGIEVHGSDQRVENNTITGYAYGVILAGLGQEQNINQLYQNNTITGAMGGVEIWSGDSHNPAAQPGLEECLIQDNVIQLFPDGWRRTVYAGGYTPSLGIFLEPNSPAPITGLAILNNQITYHPGIRSGSGDLWSGGIVLWKYRNTSVPVTGLTISGNTVTNSLTSAIWSNAVITGPETNLIQSNTLIDPARSGDPDRLDPFITPPMRTGIYIAGTTSQLTIQYNTTIDDAPVPLIQSGVSAVSTCTSSCSVGAQITEPGSVPLLTADSSWVSF